LPSKGLTHNRLKLEAASSPASNSAKAAKPKAGIVKASQADKKRIRQWSGELHRKEKGAGRQQHLLVLAEKKLNAYLGSDSEELDSCSQGKTMSSVSMKPLPRCQRKKPACDERVLVRPSSAGPLEDVDESRRRTTAIRPKPAKRTDETERGLVELFVTARHCPPPRVRSCRGC